MPRITLVFTLSGPQSLQDLLHEFTLHAGVVATAAELDGRDVLRVETNDSAGAAWDVRATVGMFDDAAVEIDDQA